MAKPGLPWLLDSVVKPKYKESRARAAKSDLDELRKDIEEPSNARSKIDDGDPKREMPGAGKAKPSRAMFRGSSEKPECKESGTKAAGPVHAQLCKEVEGPKSRRSRTDITDPSPCGTLQGHRRPESHPVSCRQQEHEAGSTQA